MKLWISAVSEARLVRAKSVVTLLAVAVLNALHEAGLADFHILVEI